jgi:hypothetical protein
VRHRLVRRETVRHAALQAHLDADRRQRVRVGMAVAHHLDASTERRALLALSGEPCTA